nr:hypothetical protein GZ3D4_4 [uncultured archaeon GZfos3D4]
MWFISHQSMEYILPYHPLLSHASPGPFHHKQSILLMRVSEGISEHTQATVSFCAQFFNVLSKRILFTLPFHFSPRFCSCMLYN